MPEYDVVHPFLADHAGEFVSNNLNHKSRQRRSPGKENELFYKMDALGRKYHLKMSKSDDILTPDAKVKIIEADGKITVREPLRMNYYQGHVVSDPHSMVAITNDDSGLVGRLFIV